jgi:5'-deoxynucleotidase YfbR-like HD superfamily hydrolase
MDAANTMWFDIVLSLKGKVRRGWIERGLPGDTIGEHCFGSDFVSWLFCIECNANTQRVLELSIVHELVMGFIDDVTPRSDRYCRKSLVEEEGIRLLIDRLNGEQACRFMSLWDEFKSQETLESNIAREAAKIETLLQVESKELAGHCGSEVLLKFIETYSPSIRTCVGIKYLVEIRRRCDERRRCVSGIFHGDE